MEQNEQSGGVGRRQLMKGAAWTAPGAAVAVAAPAYAASACQPSFNFSGGLFFNQGSVTAKYTDQSVDMGGQTYVYNLPADVTVQTITYHFWIQNRDGQDSPGPGVFFLANSTANTKSQCSGAGCTVSWTPTAGSGFENKIKNTANMKTTTFPNGQSNPAWDVIMTWNAGTDTKIASRYTSIKGTTCRNFDTGPSSRFKVSYTNVVAMTETQVKAGMGNFNSQVTITITLSNGTVLTATQQAK